MTRAFRWLMRLLVGALALGGTLALLAYYVASRSLPDYTADYAVDGIDAPLEIVRDTAGVPHIFGARDADVFFGLGFAHAQDRLWQMTMLRRTVQGRLSELFGARTVRIDEMMRRLDLYRLASTSVAAQDAYTQAALGAYAAGVNAWIAEVNAGARGRGAPEFFLFPPEIAAWQPADSLAIVKLLGVQLSAHVGSEVRRARAAIALPDEARLRDLLPDDPGPGIAALSELVDLYEQGRPTRHANALSADPLSPFRPPDLAGASNAWAAAPSRAASGGTLLASDPHLAFSAPAIWYLARLELSSGGVIGGTVPGVPLVLLGRNERIGWGLTTAYADDADVYIEEVDPQDPDAYRTPSGFAPFRTDTATLRIKDAEPLTLDLRWTENGPVLPPSLFDLGRVTPPGHVTSVAWTVLDGADTSVSAGLELMRAGDVDAAMAAGERFVAPAQNLMLIDRDSIALQTIGALPRRSARHESQGRIPSRGWLAKNRWQGMLGYPANPSFKDPESGILGNTNNKIIERPFPLHVSHSWGDTQRIVRLQRLMQERPVHTRDSFIGVQLDTVSIAARTLLPLIGADLWYTGEAAPEGTVERRRREAVDLLSNWNGEMNEHLPEPLIYAAWMHALQRRLVTDELGGALASEFARPDPVFIERVFRDIDGAGIWCDIVRSTPRESCAEIARLALDDALQWIEETQRGSLESLHWGDAHEAAHDHPVLSEIPILGWLVNIRQSTSGGDHTLARGSTGLDEPEPFLNVHGAGYRGVYDMADPDGSVFVIATGQSGHPLSRFYDNLGELWRRGEYIPMSLDPDLARAAATGITRLEPAR